MPSLTPVLSSPPLVLEDNRVEPPLFRSVGFEYFKIKTLNDLIYYNKAWVLRSCYF